MRNQYYLPIFFLTLIFLAGCNSTPIKPAAPADPQAAHAARMFEDQRYDAAADLYLDLARRASSGNYDLYLLLAADSLIHDDQVDKAENILRQLQRSALPQSQQFRYTLVQADLANKRHQPDEVLRLLSVTPANANNDSMIRFHALRAAAYKELLRVSEYIAELIKLDSRLASDEAQLQVQTDILTALTRLTPQTINEQFPAPDKLTRGWLELAGLLRDFPNEPAEIIAPYREWRDLFPEHPAVPGLLSNYYSFQQQQLPATFAQIAVLLPLEGPYAIPARTIRDGLMSAWYSDNNENRPRIKFYDSSNSDQIWPLLNQAAEDGADMVIGPLSKSSVRQLARAGTLPLPVLALNQVNTDSIPPSNLYQFSLSPEDEAHQVAVWAAFRGYREPAILYPATSLGKRMASAFMETWRELGGGSLRSQAYDPASKDYSAPVAQLVMAKQRKAQLEKLKEVIEYNKNEENTEKMEYSLPPRGIDFVFAIGNKRQMRQIRPMLQFHYAEDLPVLSTSRAWNGQLSNAESFDLTGIALPEMPWMLNTEDNSALSRSQLQNELLRGEIKYLRLLPMGIDAYQVLPRLGQLQGANLLPYKGKTGLLYLDKRRQLLRRMTWISLQRPPRVLGITPPMNTVQVLPAEDLLPDSNESPAPAQR